MFGYGSLVNQHLRGAYTGEWHVYFKGAFRRSWNAWCVSREGFKYTALGLEPCNEQRRINGVLFEVTDARYAQLLEREKGYLVYTAQLEEFDWMTTDRPTGGDVTVFVIRDPKRPTAEYPINSQYLRNCVEGFHALGSVALDEFYESLYGD